MNKKKICLFTAQPPLGGGGSVILRSMIENLHEISISWQYVTKKIAAGYEEGYLGQGFMGSGIVEDIFETWKMLSDKKSQKIDEIVNKLLKLDCDGYWVVSHNEGLRVALELTRRQKERPVHMSVHDDWAGALCARSVRYRLMAGLAKKMTKTTLTQVDSFDVISHGMRDYYKELCGRDSTVTHRYIAPGAITPSNVFESNETGKMTVGHIGSLYSTEDFFKFAALFSEFAYSKNKEPEIYMWGTYFDVKTIPNQLKNSIHFYPTLPEEQVIPKLAQCTFVYAMYPMSKRLRLFSKTSLPTKLGSYVQATRPIFGQGSADSSLAEFFNTTGIGELWDSKSNEQGLAIFERLLDLRLNNSSWQNAREQYFGERNIEEIRNAISFEEVYN